MAFWRTCKHPELLKLYLFELKIQKNPSILLWSLHLASPSSSFLSSFSPSYLHPICLSYLFFPFQSPSSTSSFPPSISNLLFSPLSLSSSGGISTDLQDKRKKCQNKRKNQITDSSQLKDFPCKKFRQVSLPTGRRCAAVRSNQIYFRQSLN